MGLFKKSIRTLEAEHDIAGLIKALRDGLGTSNRAREAEEGLQRIGPEAIGPLVATFRAVGLSNAQAVQRILVKIGERAKDFLATQGLSCEDPQVRRWVCDTLVCFNDSTTVEWIAQALEVEPSREAATAEAYALMKLGGVRELVNVLKKTLNRLRHGDQSAERIATAIFGWLDGRSASPESVEPVLNALRRERDPEIRKWLLGRKLINE
jgi:hypothetical protein